MNTDLSKADRTRQFIIEATAGIFNTKGYAGTSIADLTKATDLTKGSIYGNFENKEAVALACFDYNLGRINQAIHRQMNEVASFEDKLMVYAQVYHHFTSSSFPEGGCPILNTAIEADDTNQRLKERAAMAVFVWKKRLEELITGGIAAGEFRPDVQPEPTALSIIALLEGGIMIARVTNTPGSLAKILTTVELLVRQLKG